MRRVIGLKKFKSFLFLLISMKILQLTQSFPSRSFDPLPDSPSSPSKSEQKVFAFDIINKKKVREVEFRNEELKRQAQSILPKTINQLVDNFNKSNKAVWPQRYWINSQYFDKNNGPVFLFVGGEDEANPYFVTDGFMAQLANETNGLAVMLEHRFYGKSQPFKDLSTQNLRFLNKDQALADLVAFRNFIHKSYVLTDKNRWLSFGGSYPGMLSAYLRLKYPNLFHAALASSAPIKTKVNFKEYLEVVNSALNLYNPSCSVEIKKATDKIQALLSTKEGRSTIKSLLNICNDLENPDDVNVLHMYIQSVWKNAVQSHPNVNPNIQKLCNTMLDRKETDALKKLVKSIKLASTESGCVDITYSSIVDSYKSLDTDNNGESRWDRQWLYQSCFEFGFFQSTDSSSQPFGSGYPIDIDLKMCRDVFGDAFDASNLEDKVKRNNQDFGGNNNFDGTRVLFTNGQIDPWSALSYTNRPPNNQTRIIIINGASHCNDFVGYNSLNTNSLNEAVSLAKKHLKSWL